MMTTAFAEVNHRLANGNDGFSPTVLLLTGGPTNFGANDRQAFAKQLDRWLAKAR
jgi:hypothetical protein